MIKFSKNIETSLQKQPKSKVKTWTDGILNRIGMFFVYNRGISEKNANFRTIKII